MQPQHWGNVTTCQIGINAKPFHEPPSHTWALTHYICLALLMQVTLSGSLKFHTPLRHQYKQLLMSLFLSYKKSHGLWEQPDALGSMLRHFIWLLIRTIPLYLRDRNMLSENTSSNDVETQQPSEECCISASLIRWLRQCQQSGQKADYIQCRARLASFGAGKIAKSRGKIVAAWQYHLLDTYLSYLCQRT